MRTAWSTFPIDFKRGLVTNLGPLEHGLQYPGSARALNNFEPSIEGGYKKVLGYEKWNEFTVPGTGTIAGVIATDYNNCIVCRDGIFYTSIANGNWVSRLDLSATPGTKLSYDTFNFDGVQRIVIVDGINKPIFWRSDTNAITEDVAAPVDVEGSTRVIVFKDHVFFAKNNLLSFTSPFLETDYNPANGSGVINVGNEILGLTIFREELIVFCRDSIKRIAGNTSLDFTMQPITNKTGTISGDSVQEVGGDIVYLGPDGIRYLSATDRIGDFALERASEAIQRDVLTSINMAGSFASTVVRGKNQYRLFKYSDTIPLSTSGGFLGTMFRDQDANGLAWANLVNFKVYAVDSRQFNDGERIIFSSNTDYVYKMESGFSFDGEDISCNFFSPYMPITDPKVRKTLYRLTTYLKSSGVVEATAGLNFDYNLSSVIQPSALKLKVGATGAYYGQPTSLYGTSIYSATVEEVFNNNVVGSGFTVSLEFSEKSSSPSFQISSALLEYQQNDRK